MRFSLAFILAAVSLTSAVIVRRSSETAGVYLAVQPNCGTLGGAPANVNAGLPPLNTFKTIVSFGDGYSDNGVHNGAAPKPPVLTPPSPRAGGRASNGLVWVENLAKKVDATLKGYAADGAVVDADSYQGVKFEAKDLINQVSFFTSQYNGLPSNTTLYTLFFGINDYTEGGNLDLAAQNIAYNILVLSSSPTFARNFLIVDNYGRGTSSPAGEAYKQEVFSSIPSLRSLGLNVGFVDFANLWTGVLGSNPGYKAFGYTNPGACVVNNSTVGACSDPDHTFYWLPGTPSAATHGILADYASQALSQCKV